MTGKRISRRKALGAGAALAGGAVVGTSGKTAKSADPALTYRLTMPSVAGDSAGNAATFGKESIEHIVVVMMENRSFDHMLGWLPGADGIPQGITYADATGKRFAPWHLASDYTGCGYLDPNHQVEGGRSQFNNGACDGWLTTPGNDQFAIGYYNEADLPFHGPAARNWTVFDRYFCGILGPTIPNRFFLHTAQTDRFTDFTGLTQLRTIWDRLLLKGVSSRFYLSGIGGKLGLYNIMSYWGLKYLGIGSTLPVFLEAARNGTLAQVSFVDPHFDLNSNHPHQDIRDGETFLNSIYEAVTNGPKWSKTVLIITYDEWGGFFDHVPPPIGPVTQITKDAGGDGRRGFRVPTFMISPFARRGHVNHTVYDQASILKMIEWRFDLEPLTACDAEANNIGDALDFSRQDLSAPQFNVPAGPNFSPCA